MAGRNQADFRSGNWNEELGVLLLKALAAVAPVPRQDDFGLDAVATLLRRNPSDDCLYAEDSFYVQFKSKGPKPIIYRGHEIEWLKGLQLPLFIGVVDQKTSTLDLFPTHALCDVFIGLWNCTEVKVKSGPRGNKKLGMEGTFMPVFLGPPLLSFSMCDVSDAKFATMAYRLLKNFLQLEQRNINVRPARFVSRLGWTTNQDVQITGSANSLSRANQKEELHHACEKMVPSLRIAQMYAEAVDDKELDTAITNLTRTLKRIFKGREYLDEEKTSWTTWEDPFDTSG